MPTDDNPYGPPSSNYGESDRKPLSRFARFVSILAVIWSMLAFLGPPALPLTPLNVERYGLYIKIGATLTSTASIPVLFAWTRRQSALIALLGVFATILGVTGVWMKL